MKFLFALVAMAYASTDACDEAQEELAAAAANSTFEGSLMFLEYYCEQDCEGVDGAVCTRPSLSDIVCVSPEPGRESRTILPDMVHIISSGTS